MQAPRLGFSEGCQIAAACLFAAGGCLEGKESKGERTDKQRGGLFSFLPATLQLRQGQVHPAMHQGSKGPSTGQRAGAEVDEPTQFSHAMPGHPSNLKSVCSALMERLLPDRAQPLV